MGKAARSRNHGISLYEAKTGHCNLAHPYNPFCNVNVDVPKSKFGNLDTDPMSPKFEKVIPVSVENQLRTIVITQKINVPFCQFCI